MDNQNHNDMHHIWMDYEYQNSTKHILDKLLVYTYDLVKTASHIFLTPDYQNL